MSANLDILIPTYNRPASLAITLTSLALQTMRDFNIIISDQSDLMDSSKSGELQAVIRVLKAHGNQLSLDKHLPRRGMAEQREYLLAQSHARYVLYLDDDLILEPFVLDNMLKAIKEEGCGFVGCSVIGLSYINDHRPQQEAIEFWEGPVKPETVLPGTPAWDRAQLHNAANLFHVQNRLGIPPERQRKYKIAWVGACVLFDARCLRDMGGFSFWDQLPNEHAGEDVLAQIRVMHKYGGCGLIPSGVYHQELPTTVENREIDAPRFLECKSLIEKL